MGGINKREKEREGEGERVRVGLRLWQKPSRKSGKIMIANYLLFFFCIDYPGIAGIE